MGTVAGTAPLPASLSDGSCHPHRTRRDSLGAGVSLLSFDPLQEGKSSLLRIGCHMRINRDGW